MNRPWWLLYAAALLLIGIGYIALTPPFEGFDETAHYSSIRQIADEGTLPVSGKSTISRNVIAYAGPKPYKSGDPPFDSGNTYTKFFANPSSIAAFSEQQKLPRQVYEASDQLNWETQHPPLYYGLMAMAAKSTARLSLLEEVFLLRGLSYALAGAGVILAIAAAQIRMSADKTFAGFVIYPILLPMFFPEFARIGNDSLCLLFAGASVLFVALADRERERRLWPLLLGISLGLGLLTKALFVPIVLGYALFFGIGFAVEPAERRRYLELLMLTLVPATVIGGGWYLYKFLAYGSISGVNEAILLAKQGGLLAGLQQRFSTFLLAHSAMVTLASYVWAGTWSLVHMPPLAQAPLVTAVAMLFVLYLDWLRRQAWSLEWLTPIVLGCFAGGLIWHILVSIALLGRSVTPGWLAHILMPWVAPAMGIACSRLMDRRGTRMVLAAAVLYAGLFQAWAMWNEIALFAGCATKANDKSYSFPDHAYCLDQVSTVLARLDVIAWPRLGLAALTAGAACLLVLVMRKPVWLDVARPRSNKKLADGPGF